MAPMNLQPVWNNGMPLINNYQGGWPVMSPSNYGYMPAMQF